MISNIVTEFFYKFYTLIKLNFMFVLVMLMGGIVAGIGPGILVISDMFQEYNWNFDAMKWSDLVPSFKENFKRGNALFYNWLIISLLFIYSIYIAVQIKTPFFFILSILLVFFLALISLTFLYAVTINSMFAVRYFNLMKLSFLSIFGNAKGTLLVIVGLVVLWGIIKIAPAAILFILVSYIVLLINLVSRKWLLLLDESIVVK